MSEVDVDLGGCAKAIKRNKLALLSGDDHPEMYRYYYKDGKTITTNSEVIAVTDCRLFDTEVYPSTVYQLAKFNNAKSYIKEGLYYITDGTFHFSSPKLREQLFPISEIESFLNIDESLECVGSFTKSTIIQASKRLNIFSESVFEELADAVVMCVQ